MDFRLLPHMRLYESVYGTIYINKRGKVFKRQNR